MADHAPTQDPAGGRSFVSPAKIRILLTPAHPSVTPAEFEEWSSYVRSFESIRIKDLPPSNSGRSGPAPGTSLHTYGEVHLSFITSYDPHHSFLAPFAMHRQVLGVLGLGTYSPTIDKMELERAPSALRELHPNSIVHRAYLFDTGANKMDAAKGRGEVMEEEERDEEEEGQGQDGNITDHQDQSEDSADTSLSPEELAAQMEQLEQAATSAGFAGRGNTGLVIFPAVRRDGKDVRFYLRTLLRDFVGSILDGLDSIVKGLEGKPLETPRETLDGLSPSSTSASSSSSSSFASSASTTASTAASRASSFFSSFGSSSSSTTAASASPPMGGGSLPAALSSGSLADAKTPASRSSAGKNTGKRSASLVGAGPHGAGRYSKIKADYALLSGDLWGAIINYDACMTWLGKERALAGGQDAVWYASALEGWAVTRCLIFRMSGLEEKGPSLSLPSGGVKEKGKEKEVYEPPFARFEWGEVAEAYSLAIQIYSKTLAPPRYLLESARSVNPDTPRDYTHPLIHASACIAYARFLLSVWASSGWNAECFDQLIYGGVPPALVEDARPGPAMYAALSKESGVQRHEIAIPTSLALSHSVAALKPPDQIAVLCSLASIYGCIGFPRREAYLLRQLQATVVSLLARTLMLHPRAPVTVMSALKQIAGSDHVILGTMVTQTLTSGLGEGADAVLILALQICETYGINVDIDPLRNIPPHHILSRAALSGKTTTTQQPLLKKAGLQMHSEKEPDQSALLHDEAVFGWADLQIALLKDTICVAEMLQDHVGMAFFATVLLRDFHELLSADEQRNLIRGIMGCVRTARWQDAQDLELYYWGPTEPLCSVEAVPMATLRVPTEHPAKDLIDADKEAEGEGGGENSAAGLNNPFFWNPIRPAGAAKQQVVVVQDEQVEFLVTFQNPFKAPLELTKVRLSTSGAAFDADSIDVTLPPLAYHNVRLTGTPREGSGILNIHGCFATLSGCLEREFKVSLHDEASEKLRLSREAEADDRRTRLKTQGLDARPAVLSQRRTLAAAAKSADERNSLSISRLSHVSSTDRCLQCRVVPCQPLIAIDSPSLTHGQLILFDGEERTLKLRLTNISPLPVDFARFTFSDDLSEDIRASLSEGDLLPADAHQLEWQLLHQPVFQCTRRPREIKILPGRSILVPITVRGKVDCTRGTVHVDFAHVDAPGRGGLPTEETKNFYTRRVSMVFGMTVYPVVECGALDVKAIGGVEAERISRGIAQTDVKRVALNGDGGHEDEEKVTSSTDDEMACLLSLDVRNVHQHAVDVELTLDRDDGATPLHFHRSLPIGLTAHLVMSIPRLSISDSASLQPIPSLSSRQFILSRIRLTPLEEQGERRRFWYRQEILKRLRATWIERRTGRRGRIDLDEQILTDGHVEVLRREEVEMSLELIDEAGTSLSFDSSSSSHRSKGEGSWMAPAESFLRVRGKILNRSSRALKLLYRLVPLPSSALDTSTDVSSVGGPQGRLGSTMGNGSGGMANSASMSGGPGGGSGAGAGGAGGGGQALQAAGIHSNDPTLSQVLITDGSLSGPVHPWPLLPGQETTVSTGVCFLARGRYAFVGAVEEELRLEDDDEEDEDDGGEGVRMGVGRKEEALRCERISEVGKRRLIVDVRAPEE